MSSVPADGSRIGSFTGPAALEILGRGPLEMDDAAVVAAVHGRRVLISGAGGSIGGALALACARLGAAGLVLLDISENALFQLSRRLGEETQVRCDLILGSVCDQPLVAEVLKDHRPDLVIHAAAYKHVPLLELNVVEAVRNNTVGTCVLLDAAIGAGVEEFVFVSTDKAVRPANVLGRSKRAGEICVYARAARDGLPRYGTTRLCNVIGSSGSVAEIFADRLRRGLPLEISDPDAARFFVTPEEAVAAILATPGLTPGGEVLVTDPGVETRITEIAARLADMAGAGIPEVIHTGLRPGEKLRESLSLAETRTPLAWRWLFREAQLPPPRDLDDLLGVLGAACDQRQRAGIEATLSVLLGQCDRA